VSDIEIDKRGLYLLQSLDSSPTRHAYAFGTDYDVIQDPNADELQCIAQFVGDGTICVGWLRNAAFSDNPFCCLASSALGLFHWANK
jgi:hypothetical protein